MISCQMFLVWIVIMVVYFTQSFQLKTRTIIRSQHFQKLNRENRIIWLAAKGSNSNGAGVSVGSSGGGKGFGKVSKPIAAPTTVEVEEQAANNDESATSKELAISNANTTNPVSDLSTSSTTITTTSNPKQTEDYQELSKRQKKDNIPYFQKRKLELIESISGKKKRLTELEAGAKADPSVGAVPEMIADRMIRRIAIFFGIPVFGGLAVFAAGYFTYKKYDLVIEPGIIAYATQFPFVLGLIGITYAIISSSWDPEEGSLLGVSEFITNIQRIRDGGKRNKEIASLQLDIDKEEAELRRFR